MKQGFSMYHCASWNGSINLKAKALSFLLSIPNCATILSLYIYLWARPTLCRAFVIIIICSRALLYIYKHGASSSTPEKNDALGLNNEISSFFLLLLLLVLGRELVVARGSRAIIIYQTLSLSPLLGSYLEWGGGGGGEKKLAVLRAFLSDMYGVA